MKNLEAAAIVSGLGRSATGRALDRHPLQLTADACLAALDDAGLALADIDGLVTWPGNTHGMYGFGGPGVDLVQDLFRLDLAWRASGNEGLNLLGTVIEACMAVASGVCRHVLVFRTVTEATAWHQPQVPAAAEHSTTLQTPYGARAVTFAAMMANRYLQQHGYRAEQLAAVALNQRAMATRNPSAIFREPLSTDDYTGARMISEPLRLYDCDVPADGAFAFVISARDHAADAPRPTIAFHAIGSARSDRPRWEQMIVDGRSAPFAAAAHLWSRTDLRPADVDVAQLYDGFSIFTVQWLEALGLAASGQGLELLHEQGPGRLDAALPVNTSGGQLSEGRFIGFGLFYEACMQIRGGGGDRQVPGAELALVATGGGALAQAFLLGPIR